MAQTLEQLKQHEQALRSIHGIVRTMKTLAAVNMAPYEQAAASIEAYHHSVRLGFAAFAFRQRLQTGQHEAHAQVHSSATSPSSLPSTARPIIIAFGSDHGFCGNYNEALARVVNQHCQAVTQPQDAPQLLCVGARLEQALHEHDLKISERLTPAASVDGIGRLANLLVRRIEARSDPNHLAQLSVSLAWTRPGASHGSRRPRLRTLLPLPAELLQPPARWPNRALPDYRLPAPRLLAALLRQHIFASVFRAAAEAMATENAARLALMQQAEQNVDERLGALRQELAQQRQEAISSELMDIVTSTLSPD